MKYKLSLSVKLALFFMLLLVINSIFMISYTYYIVPKGIESGFSELRNQMEIDINSITQQLSSSESIDEGCKYLNVNSNYILSIDDIDGNIIYVSPSTESLDEMLSSEKFFCEKSAKFFVTDTNEGRQLFIAHLYSYVYNFDNISSRFLTRIIIADVIAVAVFMIALLFYVKITIINPLVQLSERMEKYRSDTRKTKIVVNEIKQLNNEFDDMILALNREEEKQSRMIASVSHDIKTPLTSIMGYAEQLKKDNIPEDRRKKYVDTIYAKSIAIRDMIQGLDEYLSYNSKNIRSKTYKKTKQFFDLIKTYYEDDLNRIDADLVIKNSASESVININEAGMLRVFGNLIDNSVKHSREDENLHIEIECSREKNNIKIKFSDNGVGVEKEKIDKIFEPFYTTDDSRSRAVSGLGLSICEEIIADHKGKIWAEESKMGGLSVVILLDSIS